MLDWLGWREIAWWIFGFLAGWTALGVVWIALDEWRRKRR